jgi:hypothetical protein
MLWKNWIVLSMSILVIHVSAISFGVRESHWRVFGGAANIFDYTTGMLKLEVWDISLSHPFLEHCITYY